MVEVGEHVRAWPVAADGVSEVDGNRGQARRRRLVIVGLSAVVPAVLTLAYAAGLMPLRRGDLADSDCYMRLVRVRQLWTTGRWYDSTIPRSNVPYGEELHWTRPLDLLLLLGAAPASLVVGFNEALFGWGVAVSPLLLLATLLTLP